MSHRVSAVCLFHENYYEYLIHAKYIEVRKKFDGIPHNGRTLMAAARRFYKLSDWQSTELFVVCFVKSKKHSGSVNKTHKNKTIHKSIIKNLNPIFPRGRQ